MSMTNTTLWYLFKSGRRVSTTEVNQYLGKVANPTQILLNVEKQHPVIQKERGPRSWQFWFDHDALEELTEQCIAKELTKEEKASTVAQAPEKATVKPNVSPGKHRTKASKNGTIRKNSASNRGGLMMGDIEISDFRMQEKPVQRD